MRFFLDYDERLPLSERYRLENGRGLSLQGSSFFIMESVESYIDENYDEFYSLKLTDKLDSEQKEVIRSVLSPSIKKHNLAVLFDRLFR